MGVTRFDCGCACHLGGVSSSDLASQVKLDVRDRRRRAYGAEAVIALIDALTGAAEDAEDDDDFDVIGHSMPGAPSASVDAYLRASARHHIQATPDVVEEVLRDTLRLAHASQPA